MPITTTNISALQIQQAMVTSNRSLTQAAEQLATGLRVNSAADDAASSSIGSQMASRILSLNQAVRNANDGISMIQTADGAAQGLTDMLARMQELAVQAANDTYSSSNRTALNAEFSEIKAAMTAIINNTTWNGMRLLDGSTASASFQIGIRSDSNNAVSVTFQNLSSLSVLSSTGLTTHANALSAIGDVATSLTTLETARAGWGAAMNRLAHAADNSANVSMNLSASQSRLIDADYAKATADFARAQILTEAGSAMLSQANQQGVMVLHLLS